MKRNYRIVGLAPAGDHSTVVIHVRRPTGRRETVDTGVPASAWGDFGLSRAERGILRRGLTAAGRDRRPRRSA